MTHVAYDAPVAPAISFVRVSDVVMLTMGNGLRHNVLSPPMWSEIEQFATNVGHDAGVKSVVIRGAAGTFSAGSDLRLWRDATPEMVDEDFAIMESALAAVESIPVPTVAVVEGTAAGAGCELALACDLRLFASSAQIGLPILKLGVLVSPHFALRLSLLVGVSRTRDLLYSGRFVSAVEAERIGLATRVVADDNVTDEIERMLASFSRQPLSGLRAAKEATSIALDSVRAQHDFPEWSFSDPHEFPGRIRDFFER